MNGDSGTDCELRRDDSRCSEETVRIAVGKLKNHVRTAITVRLDEDFTLRIHIDGRRIYMSVSDHTVSIQSRSWRVGQRREAVAWILGYISGYRQ